MFAAVVGVGILLVLAVFQLTLITGAPWGRFAWGGQFDVLPRELRISSGVAIVVYALITAVILQAAGLASVLPDGLVDVAIWVLVAYFALGIALNASSRSRSERVVMTPTAAVLAVVCLVLALG